MIQIGVSSEPSPKSSGEEGLAMSTFPTVLTVDLAAKRLLTTADAVRAELDAGRLAGFKVNGEWRTTEAALLKFMNVPAPDDTTPERTAEMTSTTTAPAAAMAPPQPPDIPTLLAGCVWEPVPPFGYRWPEGVEQYEEAYGTRVRVGTRDIPVLIGFCTRESAGDPHRRRAVVFMGHQPSLAALVEFSGENSDVFPRTGRMASVIKLPTGKHLKPGDPVPPAYAGLPLAVYKTIVRGPYAAASMAVVAQKDDYTLMAHHGLLRARERGAV
jgi:hypothetical protein